jgi:ferredoxin
LKLMERYLEVALIVFGAAAGFGFGLFAVTSLEERESRAAAVSAALAFATAATCIGAAAIGGTPSRLVVVAIAAAVLSTVAAWLWPVGRSVAPGGRPQRRFDERDIMFARARLQPGSEEFDSHYARRPEHRAGDDRTRALPGLLSPDAEKFELVMFATAEACFEITEQLRLMVDGTVAERRVEKPPDEWTAVLKKLMRFLGAVDVGVAPLRPYHVYSHVGRGTGTWGEPVDLDHAWAIAFTVEMDHGAVAFAPGAPTVAESARQYVALSRIGVEVASVIRRCGYSARAHTDGNYRVIAPLVARDAGLGEIGRMGILMTPRLGPRVRLGVVTTELPLTPDPPGDDVSVLDFCSVCRKCADNCPVGAIPSGDREPIDVDGLRWRIDPDSCFRYWAVAGTDCAICMRVCPYSHPDALAHNLVRGAIRRSGGARRVTLHADDLFYGRRPRPRSR